MAWWRGCRLGRGSAPRSRLGGSARAWKYSGCQIFCYIWMLSRQSTCPRYRKVCPLVAQSLSRPLDRKMWAYSLLRRGPVSDRKFSSPHFTSSNRLTYYECSSITDRGPRAIVTLPKFQAPSPRCSLRSPTGWRCWLFYVGCSGSRPVPRGCPRRSRSRGRCSFCRIGRPWRSAPAARAYPEMSPTAAWTDCS